MIPKQENISMQLHNRVAIITGAGRGIGRAIALAYAREGAKLALASRTISELEDTAHQIEALGAEAIVIPTDISDQSQVKEMVKLTLEKYSTIDILVNNAAVVGPIAPLEETDISAWISTINVNLIGTYLCCRAVLPTMLGQNQGKIINVTSGVRLPSENSNSLRNMGAYISSKAGVTRLTELLAQQLEGTNVYVNSLSPAGNSRMLKEIAEEAKKIADTEVFEHAKRVMKEDPSERSAEVAVLLASDSSGNLSGRAILHRLIDVDQFSSQVPEIMASDAFTIRLIPLD